MQKFEHSSLIYAIIRTQDRVLVRQSIRARRARAIEIVLYSTLQSFSPASPVFRIKL